MFSHFIYFYFFLDSLYAIVVDLEGSIKEASIERFVHSWNRRELGLTVVDSLFWDKYFVSSDASDNLVPLIIEAEKSVFRDITQSHKIICRQYADILSHKITHLKSIYN